MFFPIPIIGEIISAVATFVPKLIEFVGINILQIANIVSGILKGLGVIEPDEEVTDVGDKALQAEEDGIIPENFDSYAEYMAAVNSFEIDPEKSEKIDENKKLEKGMEVITATLVERYGDVMMDFIGIISRNPAYFEQRMPYLTDMAKTTPTVFSDITRFIQGRITDTEDKEAALNNMFDVEKKVNPDASLADMMKDIEKLKD